MFGRRPIRLDLDLEDRVILVIGGTGVFGRAVFASAPPDRTIANISRKSALPGPRQITFRFDILREPERAFAHAAAVLPHVDVLVYAAYSAEYTDVAHIERTRFLREYELDVYAAVRSLQLAARQFWDGHAETNRVRARKAILISSAAAFGRTVRPELATYSAAKAALNALGPYAHDYLWDTCGVSVAMFAPGSLGEPHIRDRLVRRFWEVETAPHDQFLLETIV
jgi:NAD(P)-dependent dehydrogenase (short-subunit alcohol dehydrogenase family)